MKTKLLLLFCCYAILQNNIFCKNINFAEALKSATIKSSIKGNDMSTHYLEPIIISISNLGKDALEIAINTGDYFIPKETEKQNIIVTQTEIIALKAGESKSIKIKGMCTEPADASGDASTVYTYKAIDNEKMKALSAFIAKNNYQSAAAQQAMWCLVDNRDLNAIIAADSSEQNNLKRFMAALTGRTFTITTDDYQTNYYMPPKERVGGKFEYSFNKAQDIQIAMFNSNGILVRELFNQKKVPSGTHQFTFEYDSSVYTDDTYYFKLIADNDVMVNQKWEAKTMRDSFKKNIEDKY